MDIVRRLLDGGLLDLYPEPIQDLIVAGMDGLILDAVQLGVEVMRAEQAGIPYAEASRRPGDFPFMTRVHNGVVDLLQLEMGQQDQTLICAMLDRAQKVETEPLSQMCFAIAAANDQRPEPALCRFLLYECLRLSIWVGTWRNGGAQLEATGVLHAFDTEAETRLRQRCRQKAMLDRNVRPNHILVAELFEYLTDTWSRHRVKILNHGKRAVDGFMRRMLEATKIARAVGAGDAVLLRNQIDAAMGRDSLNLLPLVEMHPLALSSVNAAKQRQKRLHDKLAGGTVPAGRRRLIDVLLDYCDGQEAKQ